MNKISSFRRMGIMGGSFNPVHLGHLIIAETALSQFALDQVVWVPTYQPPHKSYDLLPFAHRWAMVHQAIADHPNFIASNLEQKRQTISYAHETWRELQTLYPNTDWHWIIGLDAFHKLPHWQNCGVLAAHCRWLVAPRHPAATEEAHSQQIYCQQVEAVFLRQGISIQWDLLRMPQVDISSSLIRAYCRMGRSLRYLVPEAVRVYIHTNHLYQNFVSQPAPEINSQLP
ncbi:MAG: nicotinate (nicotinamide) nucleotide adenylyltransferase [Leptolyngbyaceae cyanobacterium bins.349]|nr:nicotinate (nicotinamide) nucleotide adenylyltransferase [Leptolyngbyaceae cyanobacterium bins.349]